MATACGLVRGAPGPAAFSPLRDSGQVAAAHDEISGAGSMACNDHAAVSAGHGRRGGAGPAQSLQRVRTAMRAYGAMVPLAGTFDSGSAGLARARSES